MTVVGQKNKTKHDLFSFLFLCFCLFLSLPNRKNIISVTIGYEMFSVKNITAIVRK